MVKMRMLRNTVADGRPVEFGEIVELSKKDAEILRVRGKAEPFDENGEDAAEEQAVETETATAEPPENAMRKPPKRRKTKKGK